METDNPRYDLAALVRDIQLSLKCYIGMNPDGKYEDAVEFALKDVMKATRGSMNPAVVRTIIQLERSVFKDSKYLLPC
jgi:hypothetical protein